MNQVVIEKSPNEKLQEVYRPFPPNGSRCEFTGKGHGFFYGYVLHGPAREHVRLVHLKQPGQSRGGWLYHAGDLLRYLDGLAERQAAEIGSKRSIHRQHLNRHHSHNI